MRIRTLIAALVSVATSLALAAPALASGAGEGWAGETNDKVVTFFCLGVLLFFILVVIFGTLIQSTLERRKDARKAAKMRQRVGW
jgi:peptidoglycan biosynthesis protein MviN/MurJ (putative lipid II flippase)